MEVTGFPVETIPAGVNSVASSRSYPPLHSHRLVTYPLFISSTQLGSQGRSPSFKPLHLKSSLLRYSSIFAALLAYILNVNDDTSVDPGLIIEPEQQIAATELHRLVLVELFDPKLVAALTKVQNLSKEEVYAPPPSYFKHKNIQGPVLDACLRLQPALHRLAFTILKYPQNLRPSTSVFTTPLIRFLALRGWDVAHKVFFSVTVLHNTMAHLQWCLRMTLYQEHRRVVTEHPEEIPYWYAFSSFVSVASF